MLLLLKVISTLKYENEIISRTQLIDDNVGDTLIELHDKVSPTDGIPLDDPIMYRELVGCLVYLIVTRPDIAYAVHVVISQFVSAPIYTHWVALLRILRYFRGTIFQCLSLPSTSDLTQHAYVDTNWVGDLSDYKPTSGFCVFLGNSLISSKSKKQYVIAHSTAETEYHAMAHDIAKVVWL